MSRPGLTALRRRSGERVAALAAAPRTAPLTHRMLLVLLPRMFRSEAARELRATFELRVDGTALALRVHDGELTVIDGPAPEADAGAQISAPDLVRLAAGTIGWPELLSDRRLTLRGDPFLGLRFPALFGLTVG